VTIEFDEPPYQLQQILYLCLRPCPQHWKCDFQKR
jgi:hypothetical protein